MSLLEQGRVPEIVDFAFPGLILGLISDLLLEHGNDGGSTRVLELFPEILLDFGDLWF